MSQPLQWGFGRHGLMRTQRFLWGFPLIGPAARAHSRILAQLKLRTAMDLAVWDAYPTEIQDCRQMVIALVEEYLDWPNGSIFLPDDPAEIVLWDYVGGLAGVELALEVEKHLGFFPPIEFWENRPPRTFSQALAEMIE